MLWSYASEWVIRVSWQLLMCSRSRVTSMGRAGSGASHSGLECGAQLFLGRRSGKAGGRSVDPASQPNRGVRLGKGVIPIEQDRWGAPELGPFRSFRGINELVFNVCFDTQFVEDFAECGIGSFPIRAVVEVLERDIHRPLPIHPGAAAKGDALIEGGGSPGPCCIRMGLGVIVKERVVQLPRRFNFIGADKSV